MSYYGGHWEISTSKANAEKYLNGKALPKIGYETDLIVRKDDYGFTCRLVIINVSGTFYVACSNVERKFWPEFFGFTLISQLGEK